MAHLTEEKLGAWMDGRLSPREEEAAEAHLNGCPDCRLAADELRRVSQLLAGLPGASGGTELARDTLAAFREERRGEELAGFPGGPWWRRFATGAVVAGLLMGLLLGHAATPLIAGDSEEASRYATYDTGDPEALSERYVQLMVLEEEL